MQSCFLLAGSGGAAIICSQAGWNHTYSKANQRVGQAVPGKTWLLYTAAAAITSYSANALNQYSAVGSVTPTYDGNGNLTFDGTFTHAYDAENPLISDNQGSTTAATYAYDGQGRRRTKAVGTTTTVYLTDADNREVLEYDGTSGQAARWYSYGLGPNDLLNQMNLAAGTRETFIPDIPGSVLATRDSGSGALTKAGYLLFGENASATTGTFRFTGQRYNAETAGSAAEPSGLYYYRARMYSQNLGRFMQPDPVGYQGGIHLYAYVGNDPLNLTDPSGLCDNPAGCGGGGSYQVAQGAMALCGLGPAGCAAGATITAGQLLGGAAVVGGAIILDAQMPKNPQPITNPPQPLPDIPEGWVSTPQPGGGVVYHPPGQENPGTGESIRVMPPGSSPVPGLENGYWIQKNPGNQPLDPSTGKPGSPGQTHVPLPPP